MRKISDETKYVVTDPNLTFKLSNFLVQTLQCTESLFFIHFGHENLKKALKIAYLL